MITIVHSNQLIYFLEFYNSIIKKYPLENIFQQELFIVSNNGIKSWIEMSFVKKNTIFANIKFIKFYTFFKSICFIISDDFYSKNIFTKETFVWYIIKFFPLIFKEFGFSRKMSSCEIFEFSEFIFNILSYYLKYTMNISYILKKLDKYFLLNNCNNFISFFWKRLFFYFRKSKCFSYYYHNKIFKFFLNFFKKNSSFIQKLPKRIFVFNPVFMTFFDIQILNFFRKYIDIYIFFFNPFFTKKISFSKSCFLPSIFKLVWKNKLYILSYIKSTNTINYFFNIYKKNSLLNFLKKKSLSCKESKDIVPTLLKDSSISFHVCMSKRQEVEVLYKKIIFFLNQDSSLLLSDIIVMCTNIRLYSSFIQSVFHNMSSSKFIPFFISYRNNSIYKLSIINAIKDILSLYNSKFKVLDILNILEVDEILNKFSLSLDDFFILKKWILEMNIRWGLDENTFSIFNLPVTKQYTWKYGIMRILLGCSIDYEDGIWNNIAPFDNFYGEQINLINCFIDFLCSLQDLVRFFSKKRILSSWFNCIDKIIDIFFIRNDKNYHLFFLLQNTWKSIINSGIKSNYTKKISVKILVLKFLKKVKKKIYLESFAANKINFCNINFMYSVSFKIVCLLGVDYKHSEFFDMRDNFSFIKNFKKFQSKNIINYNKYIFLESILSAQNFLYISFVDKNFVKYNLFNSSSFVKELIFYIVKKISFLNNKSLKENYKDVYKYLVHVYNINIFSKVFLLSNNINFFSSIFLQNIKKFFLKEKKIFLNKKKYICDKFLHLEKLKKFYSHPIKFWFHKLGIFFNFENTRFLSDEPFIIDSFSKYKINSQIFFSLVKDISFDIIFNKIYLSGLLPNNSFGKIFFQKQYDEVFRFFKKVKNFLLKKEKSSFLVKINNIQLYGTLQYSCIDYELVFLKPFRVSLKDQFLLWLDHLIYCFIGNTYRSRLIGINCEYLFLPLNKKNAKIILLSLIDGYYLGLKNPILLIYIFGSLWFNNLLKNINYKNFFFTRRMYRTMKVNLLKTYKRYCYFFDNINDFYLRKILSLFDDNQVNNIIKSTCLYLFPMFNFIKKIK